MVLATLSGSLFTPLWVIAIAYAALYIAAQVADARGATGARERLLDLSFLFALIGAAWVAVLLLIAVVSEPDLVWDMLTILLIVVVFFGVLLFVLFGIFELLFSRGSRRAQGPTD
jgi:hypothetical protein